jgi:hypothetical protein
MRITTLRFRFPYAFKCGLLVDFHTLLKDLPSVIYNIFYTYVLFISLYNLTLHRLFSIFFARNYPLLLFQDAGINQYMPDD